MDFQGSPVSFDGGLVMVRELHEQLGLDAGQNHGWVVHRRSAEIGRELSSMDVQEALKLLRYRLGREVSFRPVGVRGGLPVYRVDGGLLSEREILAWVASLGGRRGLSRRNGAGSLRAGLRARSRA